MNGERIARGQRLWMPVNRKGFRLAFEMSPEGFVRQSGAGGQGRWLVPEVGGEPAAGPGYRLEADGRQAWLGANEMRAAFGLAGAVDAGWLERTVRAAQERNRILEERARLRDPLGALLQEAEGDALTAILATVARGCPWERSRIHGDARGADPVLGY